MNNRIEGTAAHEFTGIALSVDHEVVSPLDRASKLLEAALPDVDDIAKHFMQAVRIRSKNIEFTKAKVTRRCVLDSDRSGPGFERQVLYAKLLIGTDAAESIGDDRTTADVDLRREVTRVIDDAATHLGERIAAFRAYNKLTDDSPVVIRSVGAPLQYLKRRSDGSFLNVAMDVDAYYIRLGGYFFITPPGEQITDGFQ